MTLWEKSGELGGQLKLARMLPSRGDFGGLLAYYETNLPRLGVKIELNHEGTAEEIAAAGFDDVVVAVGGNPNKTELPVKENHVPVVTSTQVIRKEAFPGGRVVVVGGSYIGVETARLLARQGSLSPEQLFHLSVNHAETPERLETLLNSSARQVWLVERGPKIGFGYESGHRVARAGRTGPSGREDDEEHLCHRRGGGWRPLPGDGQGGKRQRGVPPLRHGGDRHRRPPGRCAGREAGRPRGEQRQLRGQRRRAEPGHRRHPLRR